MKAYYYLFYKLYRFWEVASIPAFWSEVKALICIIALEELTVASLMAYYKVFLDTNSHLLQEKWIYILTGFLIISSKYFIFLSVDQWKQIVHDFDKQPKKENDKGGVVVGIVVFAAIANFFIAFYLYLR